MKHDRKELMDVAKDNVSKMMLKKHVLKSLQVCNEEILSAHISCWRKAIGPNRNILIYDTTPTAIVNLNESCSVRKVILRFTFSNSGKDAWEDW